MAEERRIRLLGAAGIMGGLCFILAAFIFVFTHGTTSINKMETFLGLNEVDWGRIGIIVPLLWWAGPIAFGHRTRDRRGRLAQVGYTVASVALATRIISEVPQFLINMRTDYTSPLGASAWFLFLLSTLALTVGLLLLGIGNLGNGLRQPIGFLPLLIGLLIVPTFLVEGAIGVRSDDSTPWRILGGAVHIPLGLAWSWLGLEARRN